MYKWNRTEQDIVSLYALYTCIKEYVILCITLFALVDKMIYLRMVPCFHTDTGSKICLLFNSVHTWKEAKTWSRIR